MAVTPRAYDRPSWGSGWSGCATAGPRPRRCGPSSPRSRATTRSRPVTVVVPSNHVGVAARRLLASGALGPVARPGHRARGGHVRHALPPGRAARRARAWPAPAAGRCRRRCIAAAFRAALADEPGPVRPGRRSTPRPRPRSSPPTASCARPRPRGLDALAAAERARRRRRAAPPRRPGPARGRLVRRAGPHGRARPTLPAGPRRPRRRRRLPPPAALAATPAGCSPAVAEAPPLTVLAGTTGDAARRRRDGAPASAASHRDSAPAPPTSDRA